MAVMVMELVAMTVNALLVMPLMVLIASLLCTYGSRSLACTLLLGLSPICLSLRSCTSCLYICQPYISISLSLSVFLSVCLVLSLSFFDARYFCGTCTERASQRTAPTAVRLLSKRFPSLLITSFSLRGTARISRLHSSGLTDRQI